MTNPSAFVVKWGSTATPENFTERVTVNGTDYAYMTGFDSIGNHCLYRKEFSPDYVAGCRLYLAGNYIMVRDWLQALADSLGRPVLVEWYTNETTYMPAEKPYT